MQVNDLVKRDSSFSESAFITKVNNTYIMLLTAIMTNNLDRVKHKISQELYDRYSIFLKELDKANQKKVYQEMNIKDTKIINITENDNQYLIEVKLISRYMDYIVNSQTNAFLFGNNTHRIEKENRLLFSKSKQAKSENDIRKCPNCDAIIDANSSGICEYCKTPYNTKDYDWVLVSIATYD